MELIKGKDHLPSEYSWMRTVSTPSRLISGFADTTPFVCAVAGTRPLIHGDTVFGSLPHKAGFISLYKTSAGIYELARTTPGIHYYWSRQPTKRSEAIGGLPTMQIKGRPTMEEPWHSWDEDRIARTIVAICEDLANTTDTIDIVCVAHGINHWGFEAIFQQRWPYEHALWKKHKKIPTIDQLTNRSSRGSRMVSSINQ